MPGTQRLAGHGRSGRAVQADVGLGAGAPGHWGALAGDTHRCCACVQQRSCTTGMPQKVQLPVPDTAMRSAGQVACSVQHWRHPRCGRRNRRGRTGPGGSPQARGQTCQRRPRTRAGTASPPAHTGCSRVSGRRCRQATMHASSLRGLEGRPASTPCQHQLTGCAPAHAPDARQHLGAMCAC